MIIQNLCISFWVAQIYVVYVVHGKSLKFATKKTKSKIDQHKCVIVFFLDNIFMADQMFFNTTITINVCYRQKTYTRLLLIGSIV